MLETYRPADVQRFLGKGKTPDLEQWRVLARPLERRARADLRHILYPGRSVGGGAPAIATTLATLHGAVTTNNFTTFASIIGADDRGPFSSDYFNTLGATWGMEATGILSVVAATTPTIQFRAAFGAAYVTIATMLAQTAIITAISGAANVPMYFRILGATRVASGSTSTMIVTGFLLAQIATAAANNIDNFFTNATPPTAVTTDISASSYLDLQAQWSAAAAGNTITMNHYVLQSLWS